MANYNCTISDLSRYIGNINLSVLINDDNCNNYCIGNRTQGESSYKIKIDKISTDTYIPIKIDTILRKDNAIEVVAIIPKFDYNIRTLELSPCYSKGSTCNFKCYSEQAMVKYTISSETVLDSFKDFKKQQDYVIDAIRQSLFYNINALKNNEKWTFTNICFHFKVETIYK